MSKRPNRGGGSSGPKNPGGTGGRDQYSIGGETSNKNKGKGNGKGSSKK